MEPMFSFDLFLVRILPTRGGGGELRGGGRMGFREDLLGREGGRVGLQLTEIRRGWKKKGKRDQVPKDGGARREGPWGSSGLLQEGGWIFSF